MITTMSEYKEKLVPLLGGNIALKIRCAKEVAELLDKGLMTETSRVFKAQCKNLDLSPTEQIAFCDLITTERRI